MVPSPSPADPRVPIYLDAAMPVPGGVLAYLVEAGAVAPPGPALVFAVVASRHAPGCACCLPRGPVAAALGRLFAQRARGEVAFFGAVQVVTHSQAGRAAVAAALTQDVLVRARYRPAA